MKCNKCLKKIPNGEEIIKDKEYLHEECFNILQKQEQQALLQKKEETKQAIVYAGLGGAALFVIMTTWGAYPLIKDKKICSYCDIVCHNACEPKKADRELVRTTFKFVIATLLTIGTFWITGSYLALFIIPIVSLIIFTMPTFSAKSK